MMDSSVRKSLFRIGLSAILLALLLVVAPAWGVEGAKVSKEVAAQAAPSTTRAGCSIDEEIAAARANIKADPANAVLPVRLAYLLVRKGALDDAMRSFDDALKLNPRMFDAKTGRGVVLARKGEFKEAERILQDALLLNPNPVRTHYELGLVYEKLGDPEKAMAEFKDGIKKHEQGRM
jgi:tetratricopeptide (TPR) repeat protein